MNHYHFLLKELIQHPHKIDWKNAGLLLEVLDFMDQAQEEVTTGSILEAFRDHPQALYIAKLAREPEY